jgi:aryl-alcohol dehydrogenase-like predicted oxidoreductase
LPKPNYNLYERATYETTLEPLALQEKLEPVLFAGGGISDLQIPVAGRSFKESAWTGREEFLNDRGFRILQGLDTVAAEHKATPAQVALAWLMARPSITAPIASATSVEQLNDLAKATRLELSTDCVILPRIYADEHGSEFWFDVCGEWTCPLLRQRVAKDMTYVGELLRA